MSSYHNGSDPDKWYIFSTLHGWVVSPPCDVKIKIRSFPSGHEALAAFAKGSRS